MQVTPLPYEPYSAKLFAPIAQEAFAIFLDSAHPHYPEGRFDIISANPIKVLTENEAAGIDPFTFCQDELNKLKVKLPRSANHLPFTVGAMGYFSYDCGRLLETMPEIALDDISLPLFCVGIYDWSIVVDHHEKKTHLITCDENQIHAVLNLLKKPDIKKEFQIKKPFKTNLNETDYKSAFAVLMNHIQEGDCYEANLCQRFSTTFAGSTWAMYEYFRERKPAPYSAYFNLLPNEGAILSYSPERFILVDDGIAETKPIKGTRPRSNDPFQDQLYASELLSSEKDRAENLMIVDLLRNDFSKCCEPGSVNVPKLFELESFKNVHHLVSTVTGKLKPDYTALDLLRACFPGGSITGAPKLSAMKIIEKLEPHRRSVYCGSLGYIDISGRMDTNIAIRTMICDKNTIHCYAGGAIVSDSNWQDEYQEAHQKVKPLIG